MKFEKIHLFIILLLALIFCSCLGGFMREGMENKDYSKQSAAQRKFDKRFDKAMVTYKQQEELAKKQQEAVLAKQQQSTGTSSDLTAFDDKIEEDILGAYAMGQYPSSAPTTQNTSNQYSSGNPYQEVYGNDVFINRQPQNTITVNGSNGNGANGAGIPRSSIPPGQEDLYILKSEIVPPVCPACPQPAACPREEKCPPCPPCARCPEPAFECKKVPNYSSANDEYLPRPVLADFSQFGM